MTDWRTFPLCEKYEVSDQSDVRHAATKRVMVGGMGKSGYRQVTFRPDGKYGRHVGYTVHRTVMLTFVGPRPVGKSIDHINRDRLDNRLVNLRYISERENSAQGGEWHRGRKKTAEHAAKVGATMRGENHPMAKLTNGQTEEIRRLRSAGHGRNTLASQFGVTPSRIYQICRRIPHRCG